MTSGTHRATPPPMPATENPDGTPRRPEDFWEELYGGSERRWSGRVNPVLADVVGPLAPGSALDLGCGEGGDAVWLAGHGWDVTAVDVSPTAVRRTTEHAAEAGVGDRVRAERHDLARTLPDGTFDLVSAQFLQTPLEFPRAEVLRRLAGQVRPGGLLLVVDHGSAPSWAWAHDHEFPTPEQIADEIALSPDTWTRERVEMRERDVTGPNGEQATILDAVVAFRRR